MQKNRSALFPALFLPLAVGGLAGYFIRERTASYQLLLLPPGAPPAEVFPVVWTLLYLLMGWASWLIYTSGNPRRGEALGGYALSLLLNFIWPLLFFNRGSYLLSLLVLLVLLWVVSSLARQFGQIDPLAGALLLPYLLWCGFAAYLNLGVYLLNR